MVANTSIEWADHTFNPWEGCQKVGPGCDHCYAETRNARYGGGVATNWGPGAPRRRTSAANWRQPLQWNREAAASGIRPRVFCASLADVFDNAVPHEWREDLFARIDATPHLDWLLLTKRIGNVASLLAAIGRASLPLNVWLGATVVNQAEADRDVPKLLATPAEVRFLSIEPLLGAVTLPASWLRQGDNSAWPFSEQPHSGIDWIIVGGESGPGARPMHPDWARSLRDQCAAAEVPFLFKQWGEWLPAEPWYPSHPVSLPLRAWGPDGWTDHAAMLACSPGYVARLGKKAAGRLLDGVAHDGFPTTPGGAAVRAAA